MALTTFQIDINSPVPLHAQVENILRELTNRQEFRDGALLPDEVTMANHLGISRGTVRAAILRLVHQGVLERRAGVGTRVVRRQVESGIGEWRSFSREMAKKGINVDNFKLHYDIAECSVEASRALQIKPNKRVYKLDRVRGWDGHPVLHSCSWFHPRLELTGREDFSKPVYEVLSKDTGATVESAHEEFRAVSATSAMAEMLQVNAGEPLLLRCHTVFDAGQRPIEYCEVHYVSSRFALTVALKRGAR